MSEPAAGRPEALEEDASSDRWRPQRAGIRNIWEYDQQEFAFAGGRLVLRGPNGSGKSNALALLVPFLLDGVMAANRMDSLGGGRSMRTLLLCLADDERRGFRHEQRTGYVWLEFVRGDDHVTIGCGARASTQREADAWFFVTGRRPGPDLELAPGGVPLSRRALIDEMGPAAVFDSAEQYRAAVDKALFGLGDHRYANLVDLLLVLRRPHLAGKLNLDVLSKVLSDGLAGIDDRLLADVAASFEDLQAVERDLRRLSDAHHSVGVFLPVYRRYLRAAARTRAAAMTDTGHELAGAARRVSAADRMLVAVGEAEEANRLADLEAAQRRAVADRRRQAVFESPAYRDAASLVEAQARAADLEAAYAQAVQRHQVAKAEHSQSVEALTASETAVQAAGRGVDDAYGATTAAADRAGIAWPLRREEVASGEVDRVARGLAERRRQDVAEVRQALGETERAEIMAEQLSGVAERTEEVAERAEAHRGAAADVLEAARRTLADDLTAWALDSGAEELAAVADVAISVGEPDAPSIPDTVAALLQGRRHQLAADGARAEDRVQQLTVERHGVEEERWRVAADPMPAPDPVPTRPAERAGRPGAPLYACCDFAGHVEEADRAGLEAALEAAGLLDAWVGDQSDALDAWLRPGPPAEGPTLADVLVATPPPDRGVDEELVRGVLASVSLVQAGVAVLPDGRYHLGPLHGRFTKARAELIGATAREERRRRLLAELDGRLDDVVRQLGEAQGERDAAAAELARLAELVASAPSSAPTLRARDALQVAVTSARAERERAVTARSEARAARTQADERAGVLRAVCGARALPSSAQELADYDERVGRFTLHANALGSAAAELTSRRRESDVAAARVERALAALVLRERERDELAAQAAGLRARVDQLQAQLGADAQAPLRELAALDEELAALGREVEELAVSGRGLAEQRGRALQDKEDATATVEGLQRQAAELAARLDALRRPDVWEVVGHAPDVGEEDEDGVAPADPVALAAAVMAGTAEVSAEPDENALQRSFRQLLDELSRGYDPGLSYVDGIGVVEVTSEGGTFSVLRLDRELGEQVARQRQLLSERDREIFERHLLTRAAHALRDLLNDADELVGRINALLADRPTASGKSVQLRWEPETADPAVREALVLMRRTPGLLGPDERDRLRQFFQTAIAQERAEHPAASYAEVLGRVLDYRTWHVFIPHVRSAGGGIQRLTPTLYRSLSGGEQAVVLHLPLFAAAAAHYDAAPSAPRLIALDEAFAGIDEGMRAELMGLLVRFDLDVLLTGHELWGAYAQVPAIMAYDLLRQPPLVGVSAVAVRWDGSAMAEA